ncbi:MAG: MoxR family ATPase [Saprospiraceae bacterium]|nr:MoxR family ATPase [Saprospiraceae bacterium]
MINTSFDLELLQQQIQLDSAFVSDLEKEISKSLVGQKYMVDRLILGLLAQGHVLLEGMPGLAKTLAIKTLAAAINAKFSRIQFTPDLLPADIIGTMVYNPGQNEFSVRKGPVFANFILADEINRAPAKVQSALLEAMQEKQVTIGKESFKLEEPFLVLATQNPIEQEGTYPLPEAQLDRFMFKIHLNYPEREEERDIIRKFISGETTQTINPVVSIQTIIKARESVKKIYMDEKIENYILDLVFATRNPEKYNIKEVKDLLVFGASPRASIYLAVASKAHAFMQRRGFVLPEDVRNVAKDILRHRIGLSYEAEAENITQDDIIQKIVNAVEVP